MGKRGEKQAMSIPSMGPDDPGPIGTEPVENFNWRHKLAIGLFGLAILVGFISFFILLGGK